MADFSAAKTYALFSTSANKKIIREIKTSGADFVLFPPIQTEAAEPNSAERILQNLSIYDWLIFEDVFTVEFFLRKFEESKIDFFDLDNLLICACGETVADHLRFSQVHTDIITNSVKIEDVYAAIKDYLIVEKEFENLSFLILKEETARSGLGELLSARSAQVAVLPVYRVKIDDSGELPKHKALLKGGAIDEFIFTSPADVLNLSHLFPAESLTDLLGEIKISATDNITRQALEEFRLI